MGAAPCSIGESGSWRLSLRARRVRRPHREAAEGTELFRVRFRAQFALRSPFPSRSTRAATKEVRVRPRNLDAFGALLLAPPYVAARGPPSSRHGSSAKGKAIGERIVHGSARGRARCPLRPPGGVSGR